MAQQFSRFCPKLSKEEEPLRGLLSIKNEFLRTEEHTETFEKIKSVLSSPATLALYDIEKKNKNRNTWKPIKWYQCGTTSTR